MSADSQVQGRSGLFRFDEPLDVDDVPEFHAARLLVLLRICGEGSRNTIKGRTKLAKLDFFIRYPHFLEVAVNRRKRAGVAAQPYEAGTEGVESNMIRYRYGPWDHRYYNWIALLRARGLITIGGAVETYTLTKEGRAAADTLASHDAFGAVVERCQAAASAFAGMSGTELKRFVYATFEEEVGALSQGRPIRQPPLESLGS
jgi:hypothetical protein